MCSLIKPGVWGCNNSRPASAYSRSCQTAAPVREETHTHERKQRGEKKKHTYRRCVTRITQRQTTFSGKESTAEIAYRIYIG